MNITEASARLSIIKQELWSFANMKSWFGVDLKGDQQHLLAQYRIAVDQYGHKKQLLDADNELINRNLFEIFLQKRELLTIRGAAVKWGMTEGSFREVLSAALAKDYLTENEYNGEFTNVYRASLVSDFYKRFPKLERTTFSSYSGFIRRLHEQLQEAFDITISPLVCLTSKTIGDTPPEFAHDIDIITDEPMGLGFQVWLETDKPMQLRPDSCSWLTYFRFEEIIKDIIIGRRDEDMEASRNVIQKSFAK